MTQYIDKDALVAEIEKLMYAANLEADIATAGECFDEKVADAKYQLCKHLFSFLDTLEVKKVDLEKELSILDRTLFDLDGVAVKGATHYLTVEDVKDIAKRFFELGLKVQKGE